MRETASLFYNNAKERLGYGEREKKIVEDAASEEEQAEEVDLTPQDHEHAMKKAFQSFRMPGLPKVDLDKYNERATPHLAELIKTRVAEMGSA